MYAFPDTASVLKEALEEAGYTVHFYLPLGFEEHLPVVHIYKVGGINSGPLATDRISVDVYATGRDPAYETAEDIRKFLQSGPHYSQTYGLVDRVTVESSPINTPYPSDTTTAFSATYRVDTRAL